MDTLLDDIETAPAVDDTRLIPVTAGDDRIYLSVRQLGAAGDEREVSARIPSFDEVVAKVTALACGAVDGLRNTGASRVTLEFGCEVGVEAGQLIAIIGKATGKSTFKIGLEWSAATETR
ncbi:CU044_2847 family protein [Actinoplanes sp. NPDC026623]|uniref:CU044_2847 family protein n=1 Tax=Actinoplanes sp. NPDC026623 TaxID=3155610 RepID=UPI0033EB7379